MPSWFFGEHRPSDRIRDPIQGEFFQDESIPHPGEALVREGIQNSLDARCDDEDVLVRIYVSGPDSAAPSSEVAPYFAGAWDHLQAEGNGLRDVPAASEKCPFLLFEDFGTTGLNGDPKQYEPVEGARNDFFHFFRAEGRSGKGDEARGRWGVGKYVFPQASRINSIFGVTVRGEDNRRLMMGTAVLKSHRVQNERFTPDGWFGSPGKDGLVLPVEDQDLIERFCDAFTMERGTEPGLSVVVPWCDLEMTHEMLVGAVARNYFYPILKGELAVIVRAPDTDEKILDKSQLMRTVESIGGGLQEELLPLFELAKWAIKRTADDFLVLQAPPTRGAPKWSPELVPEQTRASIAKCLEAQEPVAVRVPLHVRRKGEDPVPSSLDVFLARDPAVAADKPVFIREGIVISDVRPPWTHGLRAMVVSENRPLAALLRGAEAPAHTKWRATGDLKSKYMYAPSCLSFVKLSVHEIQRAVSESEKQEDPTLLIDFFSLPAPPEEEGARTRRRKRKTPKSGTITPEIDKPPPHSPRRFTLHRAGGGFSVRPGEPGTTPPARLDIRMAYDIRRGSPLKKYHKADFQVDKKPIELRPEPRGVRVLERSENRLLVAIDDADFSLHLTGFDENRDLYVRIMPKEAEDGDPTV